MRIDQSDYEPLKAFLGWMSEHVLEIPPGSASNPMAVLEKTKDQSMARARQGLGMAVGDIVEMTDRCSPEQVAMIDAALAADGLWTLSHVRARFGREIRAILKRGSVRGESDYYALRNAVETLPDSEQAEAWQMLAAFEAKAGDARP